MSAKRIKQPVIQQVVAKNTCSDDNRNTSSNLPLQRCAPDASAATMPTVTCQPQPPMATLTQSEHELLARLATLYKRSFHVSSLRHYAANVTLLDNDLRYYTALRDHAPSEGSYRWYNRQVEQTRARLELWLSIARYMERRAQ